MKEVNKSKSKRLLQILCAQIVEKIIQSSNNSQVSDDEKKTLKSKILRILETNLKKVATILFLIQNTQ